MAKVTVPAGVPTVVSAGTALDLIIANGGSAPLFLNTTDPTTAGPAITLAHKDSVIMSAGSAFAANQWVGYSGVGTEAVVTEVA
jgi:hypothetical protein